jgi:putative hydrolase of the HAD superfamily
VNSKVTRRLDAVVFDLDGVLRHFDREAELQLEIRHGMRPGSLLLAAFGDDLGTQLTTGGIDWQEFIERLADRIGRPATREFEELRAELDHEAMELLAKLRATGTLVALLTNGTDRTEQELADHGIAESFDRVFNTARLGVSKPDPDVYRTVTGRLGLEPARIGFVDDRFDNIAAARSHGWHAHHYDTLDGVARWLEGFALFE